MPLFRKRKTLWQIHELQGYLNKTPSQTPPDYDLSTKNAGHQTLDGYIRTNWEILHPLEQDFIYSWFVETQTAEEANNQLQVKLNNLNKEITGTQQDAETKIEQMNTDIKDLNSEILNLKNALIQKDKFIEDLQAAIRYKTINAEELKDKLDERIGELNDQMFKRQEEYEAKAIALAEKFKTRVEELDGERLILNETIEKNDKELTDLDKINQDLKKVGLQFKLYQDKINKIKTVIGEIPSNLME
jgi:chromosome segregation ATPase